MDTLKYLQSKEFLPDVDPGLLFANLEELNQVTTRNFSDNKNVDIPEIFMPPN